MILRPRKAENRGAGGRARSHGPHSGPVVTAIIAGTGMGAALIDPAHLAEYLRLLAGKVQRGEYAPPSEPIN